ncbi:guanidinoacetate N-methyltransferase [Malassezia yamatoensis]|uniref:tRNA (adenine(58)-N(1))-methyltransferase catalytic subunit TRM61 n=1 Tax=Malassezia yamatoensis TaxID=253288 RepID=A0AAJ5YPK3_9BASI|nr:guanidinoacetate N-methyltransferase [Malassezia yamatoensis]
MKPHNIVQEGDVVIVFVSRDRNPSPLVVQKGQQLVNLYGAFEHDDIIGKPYGSKILYAPDMAFILMMLNITPGAIVIEAGTGSGSFTHTLARAVARSSPGCNAGGQLTKSWNKNHSSAPADFGLSDGRVFSFEFHAERVERARQEFAQHGLNNAVTLQHRDVCKDGFGLEHAADAVFLDLPAPWEAIENVRASLRNDVITRICCFSPCIEQVLRTVNALSEHGFNDISTYESLIRTHETLTNVVPLEPIGDVVDRIRASEHRREDRREMQIKNSKLERDKKAAEAQKATAAEEINIGPTSSDLQETKMEQESYVSHNQTADVDTSVVAADQHLDQDLRSSSAVAVPFGSDAVDKPSGSTKRKRDDAIVDLPLNQFDTKEESPSIEPPATILYSAGFRQKTELRTLAPANVCSRPFPQMRGHTSYLTFATLQPQT